MGITNKFTTAVTNKSQIATMKQDSILEAQDKEQRIRHFFANPFENDTTAWELEGFLIDYLRQFKIEGMKRKDGFTEDILHEFDPILYDEALLRAGILPDKVTYEMINGERIAIPESEQSIRLLFGTLPIHDLDEDFTNSSKESLENFLLKKINDIRDIGHEEKAYQHALIGHIGEASDAITFGRKSIDSTGKIITLPTHNNDLHQYLDAMEKKWYVIAAKGTDRMGGLVTRFARTKTSFKLSRHFDYLDQTRNLFMIRQTNENMAERYPELIDYFKVIDANMRIAVVTLDAIMQYHPQLNTEKYRQKGAYNPETARLDISRSVPEAMRAAEYMSADICPMVRLLEGVSAEAHRHPDLTPIINQVYEQLEPHINYTNTCKPAKAAHSHDGPKQAIA